MVTRQDIYIAFNEGRGDTPIAQIMSIDLVFCYLEETLKNALEKLGTMNIVRIAVVERNDPSKLIGLITRKCVIVAYNNELHKKIR